MLFLANIKIDMTKMNPYLGWFWDGTKLTIAVSESGNKAYVGYAITVNQMKASGYECTEE